MCCVERMKAHIVIFEWVHSRCSNPMTRLKLPWSPGDGSGRPKAEGVGLCGRQPDSFWVSDF